MGLTASKEVKKPKSKKDDKKKKLPKVVVKGKKMKGGDHENPTCPQCGTHSICKWDYKKNNKGKIINSYPYECICKNQECRYTWTP